MQEFEFVRFIIPMLCGGTLECCKLVEFCTLGMETNLCNSTTKSTKLPLNSEVDGSL